MFSFFKKNLIENDWKPNFTFVVSLTYSDCLYDKMIRFILENKK